MNIADSSAWLEYLADTPAGTAFASIIENRAELLVPAVVLVEVTRRTWQQRGDETALAVAALLLSHRVIALDGEVALLAARLGIVHRLPLADSIVYATAVVHGAELWTQDADFEGLAGVKYVPKRRT